jgi:hypothetical protein
MLAQAMLRGVGNAATAYNKFSINHPIRLSCRKRSFDRVVASYLSIDELHVRHHVKISIITGPV